MEKYIENTNKIKRSRTKSIYIFFYDNNKKLNINIYTHIYI
jgi:hypothetical protein